MSPAAGVGGCLFARRRARSTRRAAVPPPSTRLHRSHKHLHTVLAQCADAGLPTASAAAAVPAAKCSPKSSSRRQRRPPRRTACTDTSATARTASMASAAASAGCLAMASGAEGRLPRPLAPKFGTGGRLVRRLLGRFRPGAQSRSQNRTRAPVGRFDGQAPRRLRGPRRRRDQRGCSILERTETHEAIRPGPRRDHVLLSATR